MYINPLGILHTCVLCTPTPKYLWKQDSPHDIISFLFSLLQILLQKLRTLWEQ